MKQTGLILVQNLGQILPESVFEQALLHNDTAISLAMPAKDSKGNAMVSVTKKLLSDLKDKPGGAIGFVKAVQEKYKDRKIVFQLSSFPAGYKLDDIQPYPILKNKFDKTGMVVFVDGPFKEPGAKEGDGYSGHYRGVQDLLVNKVLHHFEDKCGSDIDKLIAKMKTADTAKDIRNTLLDGKLSMVFLAQDGGSMVMSHPDIKQACQLMNGDVKLGWTSHDYDYKAEEPAPAKVGDDLLDGVGDEAPVVEPDKKDQVHKTDAAPQKLNDTARTSVPVVSDAASKITPVPTGMDRKARKKWMRNRFGENQTLWPKNWENAREVAVPVTVLEQIGKGSGGGMAALNALKSSTAPAPAVDQPGTKPTTTPDAAPGKDGAVTNPDLPMIPSNHVVGIEKWQNLPYVAAILDQKGKRADDLELLKSFQTDLPPFHDAVGLDKDDQLGLPFKAYVDLGAYSLQALALCAFNNKLEILRLRGLAGVKSETVAEVGPKPLMMKKRTG